MRAVAEKIQRMSDFDDLEEFERQTALRGNERTNHQRGRGHKFGWQISPNAARASAAREKQAVVLPPKLPPVPINVSPVAAIVPSPPIEIRSMEELVAAFRACRDERGLTHERIDDLAGFPSGYAGKLMCDPPIKNLGWSSFGLGLGAFGKMLLMVDDPEQIRRVQSRWVPRERPRNAPAQTASAPGQTNRQQRVTSRR
jgi:hypothetical protein